MNKFDDTINKITQTLEEQEVAPMTMGAPAAQNPAQVVADPAQQQQQGQPQDVPQEITSDQVLQFALNADPQKLNTMGVDATLEGDELFKSVYAALEKHNQSEGGQQQQQPPAVAGQPQTSSTAPAATGTSGVPGAMSTQV